MSTRRSSPHWFHFFGGRQQNRKAAQMSNLSTLPCKRRLYLEPLEDRLSPNIAPVLNVAAGPFSTVKTQSLTLSLNATDKDKGQILTFSASVSPTASASPIISNVVQTQSTSGSSATATLTWTPTEDDGPASYTLTVKVSDNGSPVLSASRAITVTTLAAGLVGNNLLIVGTTTNKGTTTNPGNDTVSVTPTAANTVNVTVNGTIFGPYTIPAGGQINANLYGGNDSFTLNQSSPYLTPTVVVDGGAGSNSLIENGTSGADAFTVTNSAISLTGAGPLNYTNVQSLTINSQGGADTAAVNFSNQTFSMSLILNSIPTVTVTASSGTLAGSVIANSGSITSANIATIASTGLVQATEANPIGSTGAIKSTTIGTNFGTVSAGSISGMFVTSNAGTIKASGQGTTTGVSIGTNSGTFTAVEDPNNKSTTGIMSSTTIGTNSGTATAGQISGMSVTSNSILGTISAAGQGTTTNVSIGTNSGLFDAVVNSTETGSGAMNSTTLGANSGTVSAGAISGMSVTSNTLGAVIRTTGTGISNASLGTNAGTLAAVEDPNNPTTTGIISHCTIGTNSGTVSGGTISGMTVTSNTSMGTISAHGSGSISNVAITGSDDGLLEAVADSTPGSGSISSATFGTLTQTGQIIAATASGLVVTNVQGTISISGSLTDLTATNIAATANLVAIPFNIVTASNIQTSGPCDVINLVEPTVTRTIQLDAAGSSFSLPQSFGFYYSELPGVNPVITVQVNAGSNANPRYDLSLLTDTVGQAGSGIDLGGLYAVGQGGVRNIVVAGDVQPGAANSGFFGLPLGTTGGVDLPQDSVAVAADGSLPAGSILAQSVRALGFNSAAGVPASTATNTDALLPLAAGTPLAQANDTYLAFVGNGLPLAQFLNTGPDGSFDAKDLLFSDELADNRPFLATVSMTPTGSSTSVNEIDFTGTDAPCNNAVARSSHGDGAALSTSQPILSTINDLNGALGDLILKGSQGIAANVTAKSIMGNIQAVNGSISGVIQTTGGDFGRAFTDANGNITGVTQVSTGGGGITSTGELISTGNLISQINVQSGLDGVIAANGDIGTVQLDANGNAVVGTDKAMSLTRFGGITINNGGLNGQVVALGNIFGDINLQGGLSGRIAAKGNPGEFGLPNSRYGILGNVAIGGGISSTGAIFSGGLLGDDGTNNGSKELSQGTQLSISGNDKGILAAEEDINFGKTGSLNSGGIFEDASGQNKAQIDAIFTNNNGALTIPGGLSYILADLSAITVDPKAGNLTGATA
jgi:hypothetical protein